MRRLLVLLCAACCPAARAPATVAPPPPATQPATAPSAAAPTPPPPEVRLPAGPRPTRAALELTVDPREETFSGRAAIDVELPEATSFIWLNATELELTSAGATAGGDAVTARVVPGGEDFVGLAFARPVGPGGVRLELAWRARLDSERSRGVYRVQEPDGEHYAYTFFEPLDARRAFPGFDEPAYKIPWRLTFHVRAGDVALGNSPVESETDRGDGWKTVVLAESKPMPSYLVAFVVGPFDVVDAGTAGGHGTPLRFVVPRGRGGELGYAREVTPRIVTLLEEYFGAPYPYEKLDVAVVPRYWGTMEHPGLVALGQPLTLISAAEDSLQRRRIYANIAIHELAHYWFGDLVTMAWWDDTWLNEGLAYWLDQKITDRLEPTWRYGLESLGWVQAVMKADSLATVKRVRQPVNTRDDVQRSFDNYITYGKGAAVIGMFEAWIGEETFRRAIRRYLEAHAWGNATTEDLFAAIDAEAGAGVAAALATFLDQPGVPLVSVSLECPRGGTPRLALAQERYLPTGSRADAAQIWQVPVCVRWGSRQGTGRACTLLRAPSGTLELEGARRCPDWVVGNEGARGYYRVAYPPELLSALGRRLGKLPVAEQVAFLADARALVLAGRLPIGDALALATKVSADRGADRLLLGAALAIFGEVRDDLLPRDVRLRYAKLVRTLFSARAGALGWTPREGESPDDRLLRVSLLRLLGLVGEDPKVIAETRRLTLLWLDDRAAVDADLAEAALGVAARFGDAALFDRLLAEARRTTDREDRASVLAALGRFTDPVLLDRALEVLLSGEFDLREAVSILYGPFWWSVETRDRAWQFLKDHFDELAPRLREDEAVGLIFVIRSFCDEAQRADAEAFLRPRVATIDGGTPVLEEHLERIDLCIAARRRDEPGIIEFLKRR